MPKLIPLSKGLHAIVDDSDYERVMRFKWCADAGNWNVYAKTNQIPGKPRLHTFIMKPPAGMLVHHIDKDGLNCQKENLVVTNSSFNNRFKRLRSNKTGSKYRGVYKRRGKFVAEMRADYKKYYLGEFETEWEAALAYNRFGIEHLGEGNFEPNVID